MSTFDFFLTRDNFFSNICQIVGAFVLLYLSILLLFHLYTYLSTFIPRDLAARYGQDSWVVITGGSDGIGKGFSEEFARKGFNIVLIARNIQKLEKVSEELHKINTKIQTKIISADLTESTKPGFFDNIIKQLEGLDVSILVNNVGKMIGGLFENLSEEEIRNTLIVNTLPQVLLTHKILPQLNSRKKKSAIINVSSIMAFRPFGYFAVYSATKAFNDYFSRGLAGEYHNIDIISLRPSFVSTLMTKEKEKDSITITPNECVQESLKKLGRMTYTTGHWKHALFTYTRMRPMPEWVLQLRGKEIATILFSVFGMDKRLMERKTK